MSEQVIDITPEGTTSIISRAIEVRNILDETKKSIEKDFIQLCFLLNEASAGEYHLVWNYQRFDDWVEKGSGLDISARQAFYYIMIARRATALGLTQEDLKGYGGIAKLKEIMSLDPATNSKEMKLMLEASKTATLEEVKDQVRAVKNPATKTPPSYMTLKLEAEVKQTVDDAIQLARLNYGQTMSEGSDTPTEISISKCMEIICMSYIQDINNNATSAGISANISLA